MKLIINADDFGASREINQAVLQAHREGILTSASLMVGGEAAEEAVAMARQTPTLAVGLHLVALDGPAVLPGERIPHLVDGRGWFPDAPLRLGLGYCLQPRMRTELAQEIRAQFARFAATGLPLSHVDGHRHMHVHPVVFKLLLPLAQRYGARGLRLPRDRFLLALRSDRRGALGKMAWAAVFGLLSGICNLRLRRESLAVPARAYGLMQSGQMQEPYVLSLLRRMSDSSAEVFFHPTTGPRLAARGPNPGDLATLLSPAVRQVVQERRLRLSTYLSMTDP